MRHAGALLVLLAGLSHHAAAQISSNFTYSGTTQAKNLSFALAKSITRGATLRCVCETILPMEDPTTGYNGDSLGDGFGFLRTDMPGTDDIIQQILATPRTNTTVRVPTELLGGVNVWALTRTAALGEFNVEFYVVRLDPALYRTTDKIRFADLIFNDLGYDCLFSAALVQPDRMPYMRFATVTQTYGYTLVTRGPDKDTLRWRVGTWLKPFSNEVWAVLLASNICAAFVFILYEYGATSPNKNLIQFGKIETSVDKKRKELEGKTKSGASDASKGIGEEVLDDIVETVEVMSTPEFRATMAKYILNAVHFSMLSFFQRSYFTPVTWSGMVLSIGYGFHTYFVGSTYTANLVGFFTNRQWPSLSVSSVGDFTAQNTSVCVVNKKSHRDWVARKYPDLATQGLIRQIDSTTGTGIATALMTEDCQGAIIPDVHIRFALGQLDPDCEFKSVLPTGGNLNTGYYAIPFSADTTNVSDLFIFAVNTLITSTLVDGSYQAYSETVFPRNQELCAYTDPAGAWNVLQSVPKSGSLTLTVPDMAGVFLVVAYGVVLAFLTTSCGYVWDPDTRPAWARKGEKAAGEDAPVGEASRKDPGSQAGDDGSYGKGNGNGNGHGNGVKKGTGAGSVRADARIHPEPDDRRAPDDDDGY